MNTSPIDKILATTVSADRRNTALRQMTAEQLLNLGKPRAAYVRASARDHELIFVLYAADGVPIISAPSIDEAAEAASELGINVITVH